MSFEVKIKNQQIFEEKAQALKEKEEIATHRKHLATTITQASNELPELNIPADAMSTEKIQNLATMVKESKDEIGRVRFELCLQISEFQLKLQPKTLLEVWEQRIIAIKEGITTLEVAVKGYTELFEQAM